MTFISKSPVSMQTLRLGLVALLVALAPTVAVAGDTLTKPTAIDKSITKELLNFLQEGHISGQKLNDKMSARALKTFLKTLDPMKMYFLSSDVEEFSQKELELDDQLKAQNLTFGFDVMRRFQQRVRECYFRR